MVVVGTVAGLFRFPVKSMQGERVEGADLDLSGLAGDRAYAVVDREDGRIATGKHPRKWSRLLELTASYVDEPAAGAPVAIAFPDGSVARTDEPGVDTALSSFVGREVALSSSATAGQLIEDVWPAIEGLAPMDVVEAMSGGRREGGEPISDIPVASMAPAGSFFDMTTLHVLTTAALRRLADLEPEATFDVRRYRPNVLVEVAGAGFPENDWTGSTLGFGATARARVDLPTMRCVMSTLAQPGLPVDRGTLQAIARHNRVEIPGMGTWACAGSYATVTDGGRITVGDAVTLSAD